MPDERLRATVVGASGYVGTNLTPRLAAEGWSVRATARNPDVLHAREWAGVDVRYADILDRQSLERALEATDVAYYLVHCMAAGGDFLSLERRGARNLARAAASAGVRRIVYLGGLTPRHPRSQHLRARVETGEILRAGSVEVIELRAGMIVGAGSAAYEVIRDLVNHLPVMLTPRWVRSRSTPVALADLLDDLVGLATVTPGEHRIFEVAGPQVLTYEQMMRIYGELANKRPRIVPVPVLTPRLSSYWLRLVTSVPTNIARALIEGLEHDFIADDRALRRLIPRSCAGFRQAAADAMAAERAQAVPARWVEGSMACRDWNPQYSYYAKRASGAAEAAVARDALWREILTFGRDGDFFFCRSLWWLRRALDWLVGGPSFRRRRRHPDTLRIGDAVDAWRAIGLVESRRLTLLLEMRAPGAGVLEFDTFETATGAGVRVTAYWHPAGVWGLLYWYALLPIHGWLFRGMTRRLCARAASPGDCGKS